MPSPRQTPAEKKVHAIRHSLSHLLAAAVLEKFPNTKLGIGPVIENGFYYDFDFKKPVSEADLPELEKRMRELAAQQYDFKKVSATPAAAKKALPNQPYKHELVDELKKKREPISLYETVVSHPARSASAKRPSPIFTDLCAGPHVKNTKEIPLDAFKLTSIAGAYWKGSEKNKMLTRVYGVAFLSKNELDQYLKNEEEAKRRDHRKLGKELGIFVFDDMVGKGLPLWLPNGTIVKNEIEKLAIELEDKYGYQRVSTPHVAKEELYLTSGHLPHYADSMYPKMVMDDGVYYLKAMNCPHHHMIYKSEPRSYKDLPYRQEAGHQQTCRFRRR